MLQHETKTREPLAIIGYGGTRMAARDGRCMTTGLTSNIRALLDMAEAVVDLTAIPWETLSTLSICGPNHDPSLPAGHIRCLYTDGPEPWRDEANHSRKAACWPLGNAGPLDYAATDVYLTLARRYGATIYTATTVERNPLPSGTPDPCDDPQHDPTYCTRCHDRRDLDAATLGVSPDSL